MIWLSMLKLAKTGRLYQPLSPLSFSLRLKKILIQWIPGAQSLFYIQPHNNFIEPESSFNSVNFVFSNQSVTVVQSADTSHANELLFHPANFINVDENENVEPSAEETGFDQ
jgi:hypothetical protein